MQVDWKKIESNLPKKGFSRDTSKDRNKYFHFCYKGKITDIYTYTSHGSSYKVYDSQSGLLGQMKKQLRLDRTGDVVALCECPMDKNEYEDILKKKGLLE